VTFACRHSSPTQPRSAPGECPHPICPLSPSAGSTLRKAVARAGGDPSHVAVVPLSWPPQ
jgi:hypothetical protein